jgi:hypothetical protein
MSDELEIDEIVDEDGNVRRLGSLAPPEGFVSSFQTFEAEHPVWEDVDILRVAKDKDRTPRRILFGQDYVQNQRSHGSCNGYAASGALRKASVLRGNINVPPLSGAFIYSLINGNRDQGSALEAGLRVVQKDGAPSESLVPWNMIYRKQQPANAAQEALKRRGLAAYAVQTKQGFRTALAAGFPVIVAVQAGSRFQRVNQQGLIGADDGRGNHAIHADDICFIGGTEVYDNVNSWGVQYADKGRGYATWDSYAQTFKTHTFYAIASTQEAD